MGVGVLEFERVPRIETRVAGALVNQKGVPYQADYKGESYVFKLVHICGIINVIGIKVSTGQQYNSRLIRLFKLEIGVVEEAVVRIFEQFV